MVDDLEIRGHYDKQEFISKLILKTVNAFGFFYSLLEVFVISCERPYSMNQLAKAIVEQTPCNFIVCFCLPASITLENMLKTFNQLSLKWFVIWAAYSDTEFKF
jgi:hypothetical protein